MDNPIPVLLVEDDPIQRALAQQILSLEGHLRVSAAPDGLEGLELALTGQYQILLLDLILPGISALELLRRYRSQGGKAKALVLSPFPGQWVCDLAMTAGADFFLPKPVQWGEVLRLIPFLCGDPAADFRALLTSLGASPSHAGTGQAAWAAYLLAAHRDWLLKEIYIETAHRFHTSAAGVEVNIRRLIARLYRQDRPPLPAPFPPPGRPPSNGDFLRSLAQAVTFPL